MSYSQNSIEGNVKNDSGNVLMGATVSIKNQESNAIISYAITDSKGFFSVSLESDSLNLIISVSYLGYKTIVKSIENRAQNISFILEESPEELKEVIITFKDIEKNGDTLSYSVSTFKDQKDRSIADVLKKMPGIEVLPNGQITYMGQPIEKYYIEGMDMLEGRYNLANENISANDVSKVQILENHQPIKVLDSLVFSDRTSLNIKLKNNTTVTGTAEIGAGLNPILFKTNLTPLVFTKRSQSLISYQYNNTGDDLARSNNNFSSSNNLLQGFNSSTKKLLSLQGLSRPPFSSQRWLDNNEHLGNLSYLYRLKNKTDIKINLSYLNGTRIENGDRNTTYITNNDTINYKEKTENSIFLNSLNSKITIEKNASKNYFRNAFSSNVFWDSERGFLSNESMDIVQELSRPYLILANDLKIIKTIGKQLLTFNSSSGFNKTNQELNITPGQFVNVLNNGQDFEKSIQRMELLTFFSENTVGMTKKIDDFSISPKVGFAYKNQKLTSNLSIENNEEQTQINDDYRNNLQLTQTNAFITNHLNFKKNRWTINFKSPLYLRSFKTENNVSGQDESMRYLNFEPDIFISKKLNSYWEASIKGSIDNRFGEIDNLYDGYILKNYLSLIRYNSILSEQKRYFSLLNIKYRDALKAIFINLAFSYRKNENNLLYDNSVGNDGTLIIESIERDNNNITNSIDVTGSKYLSKIKTKIALGSKFSFSESPQIVNNDFSSFKNTSQQYNLNIESEFFKWLSVSASSDITLSELRSSNNQSTKVKNWRNSISTFLYLSDNNYFNIDTEHYFNSIGTSNNNNYLLNFSYQFTFKKYNLDAKIIWNNVLNTRSYINLYNGQFFSNENSYVLRPSQVLMSLNFSL
ncbi:carboxypeptidase-like regulatory domain-containing protein [Winogradskyella wichelsiae]|uniref:carboxypeptidase-like regulatory domain-containing protein n=1 Tax=Winogradskyella wichelsiae TaxID=2697007 RepID=UPI003EF58ADC